MAKELKTIYEDNKSIIIKWEESEDEDTYYVVVGKDENFNDIRITSTKDSKIAFRKIDLRNYISLTVEYVIKDDTNNKEIVIGRTNTIDIEHKMFKVIGVKAFKSYKNITLLFESQDIYDKYYIYEKNKDRYDLVLECEDFIVNNKMFSKNKIYKVEAYKKEEDEFVLRAISMDFKIVDFIEVEDPEEIDISVVIPVYNCETYLARCLDSVLLSTFKNKEIILVNDGSTDGSLEIMNWYQKKYKNIIRILNKENGGPASARNAGVKLAKGEYTAFFDSDDFIHPYNLEKCYIGAKKYDADVVVTKVIYKEFGNNGIWFDRAEETTCERYTVQNYEDMIMHRYKDVEHNVYLVTLWNQIMRTKLILEHPIPNLKYYEDAAYTRAIYSYIDKFVLSLDSYYVWDRRLSKTTGTITINLGKTNDGDYMHETYAEACFYFLNDCNKKKLDYLIYDALKDVRPHAEYYLNYDKEEALNKSYGKRICELMDKYDLFKNKLIKNDQEIIDFLNKIKELRN